MKRLNQLQRNYLDSVLSVLHDYQSFDDLGGEGIIALRVMCGDKDDENLNELVNKFIKKYRKQQEANR
jgi:hypothetical protein